MDLEKKRIPRKGGLLSAFKECPEEIQNYFDYLDELIENRKYNIAIAYLFFKVEQAHTIALYHGLIKKHSINKDLADKAVNNTHITRGRFEVFFDRVFEEALDKKALGYIKKAEKIRDKIIHGKGNFEPKNVRDAIPSILEYSKLFNKQVYLNAEFYPFHRAPNVKVRNKTLSNKPTSRWVLKGMGFKMD